VRATAVCSAHLPDCPHNPFSNDAAPDRLPLERMRAVDSFTLLSFGVLFTGLPVSAPREDWLHAPLVFDYAHAAHVTTAYWTAHHPKFANSREWTDHAAIDRLAWATDFDPHADKVQGVDDAEVIDRAASEIPSLREPFLAVVHLSGTHFPYHIDDDAPFRPLSASIDRRAPERLRNRYYDAIYRQDKLVAKLIESVRRTSASAHTVIVFLSDHGESFFEHGSVLHGSSLWDEELRVPAWIDAPSGSLTPRELASLRDLRDVPVTQVDLAPTLLDLLHIADVPAWAPWIAHMGGTSLLRAPAHVRTTDIATCNALWSCFVPSSGKLIGDSKWVTRPPDPYRCFDTRADPTEQHDLGAAACSQ
jgi:arylsulfatase A-like enzyme